jgi:hypothetical protein
LIHLLHPRLNDWCVTADPAYNIEEQKVTDRQYPCVVEGHFTSSIYFYLDRRKLAADGQNLTSVSRLLERGLMFLEHGDKFLNFFGRRQNNFEHFCYLKHDLADHDIGQEAGISSCDDSDTSIIKDLSMDLRATCGGWPKRLGGKLCQSDADCSKRQ